MQEPPKTSMRDFLVGILCMLLILIIFFIIAVLLDVEPSVDYRGWGPAEPRSCHLYFLNALNIAVFHN